MANRTPPGITHWDLRSWGVPGLAYFGRLNWSAAQRSLPRHRHPGVLEVIYLHRGSQTYQVAGEEFALTGGEVFVTFPGELHGSGGRPQERSVIYWFQIGLDLAADGGPFLACAPGEGAALAAELRALPRRRFQGDPAFAEILERSCQARMQGGPLARSIMALGVTQVCLRLAPLARAAVPAGPSASIAAIQAWIHAHLAEPLPCAGLARRAGLSLSHFKARFAAESGCRPAEYVARARVAAARDRLAAGASVTATALDLGFTSPQHFARVFRRYTGATPGSVRRARR